MKKPKIGATGTFPRGKLDASDEGAIRIAIHVRDKTVRVEFGKKVKWMGLDKAAALNFAQILIDKANEI